MIAVCVPYYSEIAPETVAMLKRLESAPGYKVYSKQGSRLDVNRNELVRSALKDGAEYVLFVDSDVAMDDPVAGVEKLRALHALVASGAYLMRGQGGKVWCAAMLDGVAEKMVPMETTGVVSLCWCGMGFALIPRLLFEGMPADWFYGSALTSPDGSLHAQSEDVTFCRRVPGEIFLDTSVVLAHLGRPPYRSQAVTQRQQIAMDAYRALAMVQTAVGALAREEK